MTEFLMGTKRVKTNTLFYYQYYNLIIIRSQFNDKLKVLL